jgi:hypothetical protein
MRPLIFIVSCCVFTEPPHFSCSDIKSALAFFEEQVRTGAHRPQHVALVWRARVPQGFVVFKEALTAKQLKHLNSFCDRTQRDDPVSLNTCHACLDWVPVRTGDGRWWDDFILQVGWDIPPDHGKWTGARYSQPFLDTDEIDYCARLPSIFPFVTAVFGAGNERFSEFNLRWGNICRCAPPRPASRVVQLVQCSWPATLTG